jgi:transposase
MPRRIHVEQHHTIEELEALGEQVRDAAEWRRIQAILLARCGHPTREICSTVKWKRAWLFRIVKMYNEQGEAAFVDGRKDNGAERIVGDETMVALVHAVEHEEPPGGGLWSSSKVGRWLAETQGIQVSSATAYRTLRRANFTLQQPRPANERADVEAQDAFKKGASSKR